MEMFRLDRVVLVVLWVLPVRKALSAHWGLLEARQVLLARDHLQQFLEDRALPLFLKVPQALELLHRQSLLGALEDLVLLVVLVVRFLPQDQLALGALVALSLIHISEPTRPY